MPRWKTMKPRFNHHFLLASFTFSPFRSLELAITNYFCYFFFRQWWKDLTEDCYHIWVCAFRTFYDWAKSRHGVRITRWLYLYVWYCFGADCEGLCRARCSLHSRPNRCNRACGTCCVRCKCVPPGTAGNREVCGSCYTDMTTHGNRLKCPWNHWLSIFQNIRDSEKSTWEINNLVKLLSLMLFVFVVYLFRFSYVNGFLCFVNLPCYWDRWTLLVN